MRSTLVAILCAAISLDAHAVSIADTTAAAKPAAVQVPVDANVTTAADSALPGSRQSVGLVLSGGGAKGIAHIGVIKALEDADIPIDYITGTSMGAIVGGLYACGYTTEEMMDLLLSRGFSFWSTGRTDPGLVYGFARPEPTPALINVPFATSKRKTSADSVMASIINPLPMNFAFMELFAGYTAQCGGDFDRLFVPFRCVASDVAANCKVVHRGGSVGDAIRTSMTFPIVFQPISVDGRLLYDGGLFDNFPVDVMQQDFAPDFIIGVDVSSSSQGPQTSLLDQVNNLVDRPQSYEVPDSLGIKIRVHLDQFGLLDFPAARRIYQVGYDKAMSMIDSIKGRVISRTPAVARNTARAVFKSKTPYVRFDSVTVTGATPRQNLYIEYMFRPAHADTFGIRHARESFYRSISNGRLKDLYPQALYNDSTRLFKLSLRAAPKNELNVGLGGYISSSASSYLFLSGGFNTLSFSSVSAGLNAWIGQSYMAGQFKAALNLHTGVPSALGLTAVVSRLRFFETDRLFFEDNRPAFIVDHEYYTRLFYDLACGSLGKLSLAVGYGHLYDSYFRLDSHQPGESYQRDNTTHDLGQIRAEYINSTLDAVNYASAGHRYQFTAMGVMGYSRYRTGGAERPQSYGRHPKWMQLEVRTDNYFAAGKHFVLGLHSDIMLSTRKLSGDYDADIVNAPAFYATPSMHNVFNAQFRANSFVAATLEPIYKFNSSLSARLSLSAFLPVRRILPDGAAGNSMSRQAMVRASRYGDWFSDPRFFGEAVISYALPIPATVSAYVNYASSGVRPWSVGLAMGIFLHAPKFLR